MAAVNFKPTPLPIGSSLHYALLFTSPEQKHAALLLHAFYRELTAISKQASEGAIIEAKLKWWQEEIGRLYQGKGQHPLSQTLWPIIQAYHLPEEDFRNVIEAMQLEAQHHLFPSEKELIHFCKKRTAIHLLLSTMLCGAQLKEFIIPLSISLQLIHFIRYVGRDARQGQLYIPEKDLVAYEIAPENLLIATSSTQLSALLNLQATRAKEYYQQALKALPLPYRHSQLPLITLGVLYHTLLDEIGRADFQILSNKYSLTPLRKLWLAWRTKVQNSKLFTNNEN